MYAFLFLLFGFRPQDSIVSIFSSPQDKVHIPGAIYLSVKFDSRCYTEEGCDELIMSSSSDFLQDVHNFSGSPQRWSDFEIPGEKCLKKSSTPFLLCEFICVHFCLFTFMFES